MVTSRHQHKTIDQFGGIQSRSVTLSTHSKYIVSSSNEDRLSLWNIANPKRNLLLDGHTKNVTAVTFSPNAHVIASASYDNTVRLWYPGSSIKTKTLKGHTAAVKTVDFFKDGRTLLTGGDDKTLKLWDSESLKFKASFLGHNNWILSAKAKSDMTMVCSGGEDKKLFVWDVEKKKESLRYDCFDAPITCVSFHPMEQSVLASTANGTISMFDVRTEQIIQHYEAHQNSVNSFTLHPEGTHMVSVSSNS